MFEAALPGIPRLITALSQWLGITVMILLLEKRKSKIISLVEILLSEIVILTLNFVIVSWLQRTTIEWIIDMVISVLVMILCIWVICEIDFCSAIGYGMIGFVTGEFAASAEWMLSCWLIGGATLWNGWAFFILVSSFLLAYGIFYYLERKISERFADMEKKQTLVFVLIALLAMIVGNLGFYRVDYRTTVEIDASMMCRLKNGEQGAKEELVLHNMRLVAHVAKKYVSSEEEQEDLISIGTIGLMKAVDSFRPEYGNKFATYAIRCVDNELLMHLRSKKKQRKEVSMFEPIGTDKEGNQIQLVDVLEFHDKNVADEVTKREQMKKICTFMNDVLSEREAFIIRRRYGIGGNQELTQREIARALGISRSYVSRIEKRALEKLKKVISE